MSLASEGPDHATHTKKLRQVGWLGFTDTFYPWGTSLDVIHAGESGGYSPVYIEIGDD
jgi:hypothetical protein